MVQILAVCADPLVKAFVLLMRYSGLRIGDVARLEKDRIQDGKMMLYTAKTGSPVWVPLPTAVLAALESCPHKSPEYYFWNGQSKPESVRNI